MKTRKGQTLHELTLPEANLGSLAARLKSWPFQALDEPEFFRNLSVRSLNINSQALSAGCQSAARCRAQQTPAIWGTK